MIQKINTHASRSNHASSTLFQAIERQFLTESDQIEMWFEQQWKKTPAPFYGSMDLRYSGFKMAPIDMNLFPAGFNNLSSTPHFLTDAMQTAKSKVEKLHPQAKKILIVPENHTRNTFYWENIRTLMTVLQGANYEVRIGSLSPEIASSITIAISNGQSIQVDRLQRHERRVFVSDFMPDIVLLNNDLSSGIPDDLLDLEQLIVPPAELGWSRRLKSEHFRHYGQVAEEFAQLLAIDPWFISPLFGARNDMNFMLREGEDNLVAEVAAVLTAVKQKYADYHIHDTPYVVVKADAGTYGMGIMMVHDAEEMRDLNRKQRSHMAKSKGGQVIHQVIIQEGIQTIESFDGAVAEPVIYMWDETMIGGFYRVHPDRGLNDNLNAPGMIFKHLPIPSAIPPTLLRNVSSMHYYAYNIIARLSMLAAAREMFLQG
jgi:glutamate--cysteine ligase